MNAQPEELRPAIPSLDDHDVAEVQRLLGIETDGRFGPETAAAVAAWKRSRGQAPSPELTDDELRALLADVPLLAAVEMERWALARLEEVPRGSNRVPTLVSAATKFGVAPSLAAMGYPWCSFAVFLAALWHGGETADLGLRKRAFNAVYTPAVLAAAKARAFGLQTVPPALAFRGDLVLFDWDFAAGDSADHVGRLVQAPAGGRVRTVDGNSGGDGQVSLRDRAIGSVRAFARDS